MRRQCRCSILTSHPHLPVLDTCHDDRASGGPAPPAVAYVFANGRGTEEIAGQLKGFSGNLQVDRYATYKALARAHGGAMQLVLSRPCSTRSTR
ncbi:transposase [Bradyrhizobium sp. UFLA05-109]